MPRVFLRGQVLVRIPHLVSPHQLLTMLHGNHLISLSMDNQQIPREVDQFLLVIEVLFDEAAQTANHLDGHLTDTVERRHQYQQRHVPMPSQVGSPSAAYRPSHRIDIPSSFTRPEQVIIELECILLDGVGDEGRTTGVVAAVGGVLDRVESHVELFHQRLEEDAD